MKGVEIILRARRVVADRRLFHLRHLRPRVFPILLSTVVGDNVRRLCSIMHHRVGLRRNPCRRTGDEAMQAIMDEL